MTSSSSRDGQKPRGEEGTGSRSGTSKNGYVPSSGDLAVLLSELNRVRDAGDRDAQSPGEAMTLAATAVRMVEAQLGGSGAEGLAPDQVSSAREVLQAALQALQAAVSRIEGEAQPSQARRFRMRRSHRTLPTGRD